MPGNNTADVMTTEKKLKKWKTLMYHGIYASASMRSMDYMAFEGLYLQLNPNWNTRALKPEKSKGQHFFQWTKY